MIKPKLFVFIGKPGVGKTTLIKRIFPDHYLVDVLPFVLAYKVGGALPEDRTLNGYADMYNYLVKLDNENVVLELGTNHPEYNVKQLKKMQQKYQVVIVLCTASIETCRQRINSRQREMEPEAIERRLQRDFPDSHLPLIKESGIYYFILNMQPSSDEIIRAFKTEIAKIK